METVLELDPVCSMTERSGLMRDIVYEVDDAKNSCGSQMTRCRCGTSSTGRTPSNPWLGVSPLASLAPEVWINAEATKMTAALLKNLGQVGVAVSLETGSPWKVLQAG